MVPGLGVFVVVTLSRGLAWRLVDMLFHAEHSVAEEVKRLGQKQELTQSCWGLTAMYLVSFLASTARCLIGCLGSPSSHQQS